MPIEPDIPDTPADPGTIEAAANQLRKVASIITGHGDDVNAAVNKAAVQFSDIVSGPIKTLANGNLAAFQAAYGAASYGADITHSWSVDVQTFKTERNKLLANWQHSIDTNFGLPQLYVPGSATEAQAKSAVDTYQQKYNEARTSAANEASIAGHKLLNWLRSQADNWAGRVQRDPEDADLLALSKAGGLSWGSYLGFGKQNDPKVPPPLTEADGRHAAEVIKRGPGDPEYQSALALLGLVGAYAIQAQKSGDKLTPGQLGYLKALYGNLSKDDLLNTAYFGDKTQLAAFGNGLLALSSEKLGGGYNELPAYLRELLDKPAVTSRLDSVGTQLTTIYNVPELSSFERLSVILGNADKTLVGGDQFSQNLTTRVGEIVDLAQRVHDAPTGNPVAIEDGINNPKDPFNDIKNFGNIQVSAQSLIDVSTRNHDANYHVLTSPTGVGTLAQLTHFEWKDDGKAAAGLVNWIAEDGKNPDHNSDAYKHATQAADLLIRTLDDTTPQKNAYGKDLPTTFQNFYQDFHKNPAFSVGLADIANTYINDLAEDVPRDEKSGIEGSDGSLKINSHDRQHFLALVGANPDALNAFALKAGEYEGNLLLQVQNGNHDASDALHRISVLNGEISATPANVQLIDKELQYQSDSKKYTDTLYYVNVGKASAQFGLGLIPDGKGVPGYALGQLVDLLVKEDLQPPTRDQSAAFQPPDGQGAGHLPAAHDYLDAALAAGKIRLDQIPPEFIDNSGGKPHLVGLDKLNDPSVSGKFEQLVRNVGGDAARTYIDQYDTEWYKAYDRARGTSGYAILHGNK